MSAKRQARHLYTITPFRRQDLKFGRLEPGKASTLGLRLRCRPAQNACSCQDAHDGFSLARAIRAELLATFYPNGVAPEYAALRLAPEGWETDAIDLEIVPGSAYEKAPAGVIVEAVIDILLRFGARVSPYVLLNFLANDGKLCPSTKAHAETMADRAGSEAHVEALRSAWSPYLTRFLARSSEMGTRYPEVVEQALNLPPLHLRILRRVMIHDYMIVAAGESEEAAYSRADIDIAIEDLAAAGFVEVTQLTYLPRAAGALPLLVRGPNGRRLAGAGFPPL